MIQASLSILARTLPIDNVKLLDEFMHFLLNADKPVNLARMHEETPRALEMRYPRRFRINEAKLAVKRLSQNYQSGRNPAELEWLEDIFVEFFQVKRRKIWACSNKRQEYIQLCARMHPALPVAWHLSGVLGQTPSPSKVCRVNHIIKNASSSFLEFPNGRGKWADLHAHLGGTAETSLSLLTLAIEKRRLMPGAKLPGLDNLGINHDQINRWLATYQLLFYLFLRGVQIGGDATTQLAYAWRFGTEMRPKLDPAAWLKAHPKVIGLNANLMKNALAAFNEGDAQSGWLFCLTALCLKYRNANCNSERVAVLIFLNLAHQFRNSMIHDGVGLSRFVEYFNSSLRKYSSSSARQADGMRQLLGKKVQLAEVKVSDEIADIRFASKLVSDSTRLLYRPHRSAKTQAQSLLACMGRFHACIHLLRSNRTQPGHGGMRYSEQRTAAYNSSMKIDNFMLNPSAINAKLNGINIDLTTLVRGLDIAGDELATPAEAFAPSLRWLRRPQPISDFPRTNSKPMHLSIHAGEDYNHLLSGMRKVDETVNFCEMKSNDRIGHGLALGIRPADWIKAQPEVMLTLEEHLDNLVWAWYQARRLKRRRWNGADAIMSRLVNRIDIYTKLVYPQYAAHLTPSLLYRAWRLRRNCPIRWAQANANGINGLKQQFLIPDWKVKPYRLPRDYLLERVYFDYQYKGAAYRYIGTHDWNKVVRVRRGDSLPSLNNPWDDWISDEELDFMEAVQDNLLERFEKLGLIIEVNPSSNVFIGRIEGYQDHPIFRWYPPNGDLNKGDFNRFGLRTRAIRVCVNTDDLGIFPTSLSNEFELLKIAARNYHRYGNREVERWAEKLRKAGVKRFYKAHA